MLVTRPFTNAELRKQLEDFAARHFSPDDLSTDRGLIAEAARRFKSGRFGIWCTNCQTDTHSDVECNSTRMCTCDSYPHQPGCGMPTAPSGLLSAIADLRGAVTFLDQMRVAAKSGEEVMTTGIANDARKWLERAARAVVASCEPDSALEGSSIDAERSA